MCIETIEYDMSGIFFEVHSTNETIYNEFNIEGVCIPSNSNELKVTIENTFNTYKNFPNILIGSVHYNYTFWANRIIEKIKKALHENKVNIRILNGCCTKEDCHIKIFYKLIIESIKID